MADLAAAYGRGEAFAWNAGGTDPRSVGPTSADARDYAAYYEEGQSGNGKRWKLYNGHFAASPPKALIENPHVSWNTGAGYMSEYSDPNPVTPYIRRRFRYWEEGRTYNKDEMVVVRDQGIWAYRSLRDGNLGHHPRAPGIPLGTLWSDPADSTSPDWWQGLGHNADGRTGYKPLNMAGPASFNAPGVPNWPGYTTNPAVVWAGFPVEGMTQVGADQWASGECQADFIGPMVRGNPDQRDGYFTYCEYIEYYQRAKWWDWDNSAWSPPSGEADQITAEPCYLRLARMKGGHVTVLKTWTITPTIVQGSQVAPGTDGPWSIKLAVVDDAQGRPVLAVWSRFWGYDPFERDLDLYPWKFQGTFTDASTDALKTGQPCFYVTPKQAGLLDAEWMASPLDYTPKLGMSAYSGWVDGETWFGWGELGGAKAPRGSFSPDATSRATAPAPLVSDLAYSATDSVDVDAADTTSGSDSNTARAIYRQGDSTSSTDSNSVSVISPAFATAADATSCSDSTSCLISISTSVSTSFLLAASLLFAVIYDTATADTGAFSDAVAISQSARQGDVTGEDDLAAIGLGVPVADSSSSLDSASASVGRFSATTDATTSADSETDTLELRSSGADSSSQSDETGCELIFPATIDVSDTTSSADRTAIIAAIGQSDASAQSDIAYGYLGQFATGSDTTASADGVGISITTGVWIPPAKAPRIKLALGGPVIRLRSGAPEIDISHAGGPLIRLSLLEER